MDRCCVIFKLLVSPELHAYSIHLVTANEEFVETGIELFMLTKPRFVKELKQMATVFATLEAMFASVFIVFATVASRIDFHIASLPEAVCVGLQQSFASSDAHSADALRVLGVGQIGFQLFAQLRA